MMELTQTSSLLERIRDLLIPVTDFVFHYVSAPNSVPPYIVWAEDGDNDLTADDHHSEKALTGTIDLYTKQENDPVKDGIEQALESGGVAWYFNSSQYENETGLLHFEWVWSVA